MLFKKTLKVASATALWMVALLGATSAMAQTPLPTFSAETLMGVGPMYNVESEADLSATVKANDRAAYYLQQAGSAADDVVYIRVAATGVLRLTQAPTVTLGTVAGNDPVGTPANFTSGSTVGEGVPVAGAGAGYRYPVTAVVADRVVQSIQVTIGDNVDLVDLKVTGIGNGGITVAVYADQADAHFGEGTPYGVGR